MKNGFAVSNVLHGGGDDNNNSKVKSTLIRLRDDIDNLHACGGFHENSTHLAKPGEDGKQARVAKRGVYEAELADDATRIHAPFLYQFAREAHALNSLFGVYCPSLNLKSRGISAKVQRTAAPSRHRGLLSERARASAAPLLLARHAHQQLLHCLPDRFRAGVSSVPAEAIMKRSQHDN